MRNTNKKNTHIQKDYSEWRDFAERERVNLIWKRELSNLFNNKEVRSQKGINKKRIKQILFEIKEITNDNTKKLH